tara:strand:- start:238 stop:876 length:639 start_codon:yes stop_codon:yes gene_type:complete
MAIRRFEAAVSGIAPLLLSNNLCSDPLSQAAKDKKFFTSKRTKSDDDHMALRLIDWVHSGYWTEPGKVVIDDVENSVNFEGFADLTLPSQNFARCLRNGATAFKLGKEVARALIVENEPLINYDGPRTASEMISQGRFVLTAPVVRMKVTNWVTRLILPAWSVNYQLTIDDERISVDDLERICQTAGRFEGLGTWRPRYGRFSTELTELAAA